MKYTKRDLISKVWVRPPGWTWCGGSKGQIATFSEHCHVAYQIKGNQVCSNMVANILPANPPPPPPTHTPPPEHGHVAYQIKGNQECSKMLTNVLPANTYPRIPPPPEGGVKSSKFNFFKHFDHTHTPSIWVWLKSDIEIEQNLIVFFLITTENYSIVI